MNSQTIQNLGDAIFSDIDNNPFLNELYDNILYNYAITKFNLSDKRQMREIDVMSALRFADLLSKSTHAVNRDKHKMWAQEIIRYRIWEHSLLVRDGSGYQVDILFSLALFQETRPALSVDTSLYHSLISRWFQSVLCLMPFSQTRRILPRRFCL